jgi:hypothetical protein
MQRLVYRKVKLKGIEEFCSLLREKVCWNAGV